MSTFSLVLSTLTRGPKSCSLGGESLVEDYPFAFILAILTKWLSCTTSQPLSPMAGRGRLGEPRRWSTWDNCVGRGIGKSVLHTSLRQDIEPV
jgi:hypothetical protein